MNAIWPRDFRSAKVCAIERGAAVVGIGFPVEAAMIGEGSRWSSRVVCEQHYPLATSCQSVHDGLPMSDIDPIQLELMRNVFEAAAEEMGITLQRVAFSANIKERRDFSCAVFDADGNLIAQAAHIPVHLGSMGDSVR